MDTIDISGDSIRLGQLLKFANLIDQGSEARLVLAEGRVRVNGEMETRRGRQLVSGDVVALGGSEVRIG